jgi:hypothetical protein
MTWTMTALPPGGAEPAFAPSAGYAGADPSRTSSRKDSHDR